MAHPAFALVVGMWFAVLLGFGSLLVPIALVEWVVTLAGLPALLPAAAPPLGFTAHLLLALVAGLAGGVFGLLLGRQMSRQASHRQDLQVRARPAGDEAIRRRPISAHAELGAHGLDFAAPVPAPLQAKESAYPEELAHPEELAQAVPDQPAENRDCGDSPFAEPDPLDIEPLAEPPEHASGAASGPPPQAEDQPQMPAADGAPEPRQIFNPGGAIEPEAEPEPQPEQAPDPVFLHPVEPDVPDAEPAATPAPGPAQLAARGVQSAQSEGDHGDLPALLRQLEETLARYREWSARRAATQQAPLAQWATQAVPHAAKGPEMRPELVPELSQAAPFELAEPEVVAPAEAIKATAAWFNAAITAKDALAKEQNDEGQDYEGPGALAASPSRPALPTQPESADVASRENAAGHKDAPRAGSKAPAADYASLLQLPSAPGNAALRSFDAPDGAAAATGSDAAPVIDETPELPGKVAEDALREALLNLQRINHSG